MRILHLVTLVSPDGAYGGPIRVATNLASQQKAFGHHVTIAGTWRGQGSPPATLDGVPTKLFRARRVLPRAGFAGLASPRLMVWLYRGRRTWDVVHVHAARDLVTIPGALFASSSSSKIFLQPHGMIDESARWSARLYDKLLTKRAVAEANAAFYLTSSEKASLEHLFGTSTPLFRLHNGVPPTDRLSSPQSTEVLFLARLHERKRPLAFVRAAIALRPEFPAWRFSLVGPDEGEGLKVRLAIEQSGERGIGYEGSLAPDETLDRMRQAAIYVLPSINEPFPMSVLEAMSIGLPVVITDSCGLAPFVTDANAGAIISPTDKSLIDALRSLLSSAAARSERGVAGRNATASLLSIESAAERCLKIYQM